MPNTPARPGGTIVDLVAVTLWMAVLTGLVEGAGSVALMRLGRLPGAWWDLLWVAPLFDALLFGATGVALLLVARILRRDVMGLVLPAYFFLTASIWLGLALPYQVNTAALLVLSAGVGFQSSRLVQRRLGRVLMFWRRSLPVAVGCAVLAFVALEVGRPLREDLEVRRLPNADAGVPDVVLIVIDALRADHLSTHGYSRATSPTLTRLAAEGASFTAAFSTSPYTAPSHASLLTGLYPREHGVRWIDDRRPVLGDEPPTIAGELAARGYRTAAFSANRFWFTREQRFGRGFLRFEDNYHSLGDAFVRTAYGRKLEELVIRRFVNDYPWRRRGAEITDAALEWIGVESDRPYFVMLNYFDVHDPYLPPDPYRGSFARHPEPGGILNSYQDRYHPDLTPSQLQDEVDAYDGAIRYVDRELERLLAGLDARSSRDLLVVLTSDHGEAFGEHGAYIHANSLYLEEIHVPLFLWSPGRIPAGFESDAPVSNAAVPATVMDMVYGTSAPFTLASLSWTWSGLDDASAQEWPLAEMEHWPWNLESSPSHFGALASVVSPSYHYILHDSLGAELYRWRMDPAEVMNLAGSDSIVAVEELARILTDAGR